MTTPPGARIKRRPPSALRDWRASKISTAPDALSRARAAWDWLRPAVKACGKHDLPRASKIVSDASKSLLACQAAMDATLPLTPAEARRRAGQRRKHAAAATAWGRMAAAWDAVQSSAKAMGSSRHLSASDHAARLGERERLLAGLAASLEQLAQGGGQPPARQDGGHGQ